MRRAQQARARVQAAGAGDHDRVEITHHPKRTAKVRRPVRSGANGTAQPVPAHSSKRGADLSRRNAVQLGSTVAVIGQQDGSESGRVELGQKRPEGSFIAIVAVAENSPDTHTRERAHRTSANTSAWGRQISHGALPRPWSSSR